MKKDENREIKREQENIYYDQENVSNYTIQSITKETNNYKPHY